MTPLDKIKEAQEKVENMLHEFHREMTFGEAADTPLERRAIKQRYAVDIINLVNTTIKNL